MRTLISLSAVKALRDGQELSDTRLEGFRVRRQGSTISYSACKRVGGKLKRVTIGKHGDGRWTPDLARDRAKELLREMDMGRDPTEKGDGAITLAQVAPLFLDHIKAKRSPSTHREYKGHLDDYLLPKFGTRSLECIATGDVRKLHNEMRDRPFLANRIVATLSSLYGWQQGNNPNVPLFNPATSKLVERYKEDPRKWRGKPAQLNKLAATLKMFEESGRWSPFALAAIWLYLATGQRRDSIRTMLWKDVDWDESTVTMHVKRRGRVPVPFNAAAMAVLRKLRAFPDDGNPYVIRGSKPGQPYKNIQDAWDAVRSEAGLGGVRIHDLRHHVASMVADNFGLATVAGVLGSTKQAALRYVHAGDSETQAASAGVGEMVTNLLK